MEAVERVHYLIARLQPEDDDPGAGGGVATTARQRGHFDLGTFWFDDATSVEVAAENRRRGVTSAHAFTTRSVASRPLALAAIAAQAYSAWSGPGRAGPGGSAAAVTVVTVVTAGPASSSGASVMASTASHGGHGGHSWPGARVDLPRRSRQARCRSRPAQGSRLLVTAVTAPVTATPMTFTASVTAITVTETGRRARFPRRRRPPGQLLKACFHQGGRAGQNQQG